jgi:dihydroorotate dehydrogenase (fumarate)
MDLSTRYLGLELDSPFILGASPLVADLDVVRRAEQAGASAIVMSSLFEEQLSGAEESSPYPVDRAEMSFRPDEYLEQIRRLKAALRVPVIGSLNGTARRDWGAHAALIDQAGADALEINLYRVNADFERSAASIEAETVELVREVVSATSIPIAVKLSPFYTSLPSFAQRLVDSGAKGLVLFNRFYQPDIDLERLELSADFRHSTPADLLLRLRWLAILSARLDVSLAVTGGVHGHEDALKAILCGADGVQVVSSVLKHGVVVFARLRLETAQWLESKKHDSLAEIRDRMNLASALNPEAFERNNYLHVLHSYPPLRTSS